MTRTNRALNRGLLTAYSLLITVSSLVAQPESESPYSSSEAPDTEQTAFSGPILWIGLFLIAAAVIYLVARPRSRNV